MIDDKNFGDVDLIEGDDLITLSSSEGDVDFREIASISIENESFVILQPVELFEGMEEDEALVFKVTEAEDGENRYELVLEDDTVNAVFGEYNKLLDAQEGD